MGSWKSPDGQFLHGLSADEFAAYTDGRKAVELYVELAGGDRIQGETDFALSKVRRLFDACTAPDASGQMTGFWGCLPPSVAPKPAKRHRRNPKSSPLNPELAAQGKGMKGVLSMLFIENPQVKKLVHRLFLTRRVGDAAPMPILTASKVREAFHEICRMAGVSEEAWPFFPGRKGENAILAYWARWSSEHRAVSVNNTQGSDAAKEHALDCSIASASENDPVPVADAYSRIEIDEHRLHWISTVTFPTRHGHDLAVGVRRHWVLFLREHREGAILASCISYRDRYDTNDVLRLVRQALFPPDRLTLSLPDLRYHEGAAYPGELPAFRGNMWQLLAYDRDASHISLAQKGILSAVLGCDVTAERLGDPTARQSIEGLNAKLAEAATMMPSCTGSHPWSAARRDAEKAAEAWGIHAIHEHQIVDVWSRNENAKVSRARGVSPLEGLEQLLIKGQVFVNPFGELGPNRLHALLPRFRCELTYSRGSHGALGVNLYGGRYSSREFNSSREIRSTMNRAVSIHVEDDARYAFVVPDAFPNLVFKVVVQNHALRNFPHSLEWRRVTEAASQNAGRKSESIQPSTMLMVVEGLGRRAMAKDAQAEILVSEFAGFMAQVQSGAMSYVMPAAERESLSMDAVDDSGASEPAPSPRRGHAARRGQPDMDNLLPRSPGLPPTGAVDPFGLGLS